eukprot:158407_1
MESMNHNCNQNDKENTAINANANRLWQMDLMSANKAINSLITTMINVWPNHLRIASASLKPQTIVWTGRGRIRNDINEIIQYQHECIAKRSSDTILLSRYPGMAKLCTKNEMADRLNIMRRFSPKHYDFYPETWNIHSSLQQIHRLFDNKKENNEDEERSCYIIKTGTGCQGSAI